MKAHPADGMITRCSQGSHPCYVRDLRGYCEHVKRQPALAKVGKDGDAMCEECWKRGEQGEWDKLPIKMMCEKCLALLVVKAREPWLL